MQHFIDISESFVEENITKSQLSANALFNFMSKYEYLQTTLDNMYFLPRYYPEYIEYLNLEYQGKKLEKWLIPMTCFCDIPLHQISHHAEGNKKSSGYGKFSIALHKEFGIKNKIQPIHYLNPQSTQTEYLSEALNKIFDLQKDLSNESIYIVMTDYLLEYIRMIKPLHGVMPNAGGELRTKNFHDEHEWRYIPELGMRELPPMIVNEKEMSEQQLQIYTNSIAQSKKGLLKFSVEDIRYIFVDTVESKNKIINFIRNKKSKKLKLDEKYQLISKIQVYDELKEDL